MELLRLEGVSHTYRRGRLEVAALDDVFFEVGPGDYIGIRGRRLSGKSTLLRICAGVQLPGSGTVSFRGRDLAQLSDRERTRLRRDKIGFVSTASTSPPSGRVERVVDHVSLALVGTGWNPDQAEGVAREVLQRVGANRCLDAYLDELSPGEQTQVAIAQALIREPELLLVDEPEGVPSPGERGTIRTVLQELGKDPDLAVVVASEEPGAMRGATRYFGLWNGRLLAEDEPVEEADSSVLPFRQRAAGQDPGAS